MSTSQIIIQRIIMVVALYYMVVGIMDKDYFTLGMAITIYIYELVIMNWNNKNGKKNSIR